MYNQHINNAMLDDQGTISIYESQYSIWHQL